MCGGLNGTRTIRRDKKHGRREKDINTELLSMETGEKGSGDFDGLLYVSNASEEVRGKRNTLSVDFGFTTQLHERSGANKDGELLSQPLLTTKINQYKCTEQNVNTPTSIKDESSLKKGGDIMELKRVAGRMLSRMQKGMDQLQTKYGGEKYMADEERNKKYAAKLSAECGLDFIAMFRFKALTVAVVRVGRDKLITMLMRKTIGGADTMLHLYRVLFSRMKTAISFV